MTAAVVLASSTLAVVLVLALLREVRLRRALQAVAPPPVGKMEVGHKCVRDFGSSPSGC